MRLEILAPRNFKQPHALKPTDRGISAARIYQEIRYEKYVPVLQFSIRLPLFIAISFLIRKLRVTPNAFNAAVRYGLDVMGVRSCIGRPYETCFSVTENV